MVRGLAKAVRGSSKAVKKEKEEYEEGSASSREGSFGPRTFPHDVKEACWAKAETVKGRDPARWRRDALGNVVFRKLVGCQGCLCHDFDHIVPYSRVRHSHSHALLSPVSGGLRESSAHFEYLCIWFVDCCTELQLATASHSSIQVWRTCGGYGK